MSRQANVALSVARPRPEAANDNAFPPDPERPPLAAVLAIPRLPSADAEPVLRAYFSQIEQWTEQRLRKLRMTSSMRAHLLATIPGEVRTDVSREFIRAARAGRVYVASIRGFLVTLVNRETTKRVRETRRRLTREPPSTGTHPFEGHADSSPTPEDILIMRESEERNRTTVDALEAAVAALDPDSRRLFEARISDPPVSYAVLARELGMNEQALRVRFLRLRDRLRLELRAAEAKAA